MPSRLTAGKRGQEGIDAQPHQANVGRLRVPCQQPEPDRQPKRRENPPTTALPRAQVPEQQEQWEPGRDVELVDVFSLPAQEPAKGEHAGAQERGPAR